MEKIDVNLHPLVSICIPCFNAEKYIDETINCLINQDYPNLEILVVDDHSTDNSLKKIKKLAQNYPNLVFAEAEKKGAAAARNQAYQLCNGDYIVFFDADDLVDNDFIEKQMEKINGNEDSIVVSNWGRFYNNDIQTFKENSDIIKRDLTYEEWILAYWRDVKHTTPPGRIMMPRKIVEKTRLWDETLTLNDDFQFFNEVFYHCTKIVYSDARFYYRSGINGLSSKNTKKHFLSSFRATKRGISLAKSKYENSRLTLCYANMYKNLAYEVYPDKELYNLVKSELKSLPKPTFKYPSGGFTKLATNLIGWKLTKRLKFNLIELVSISKAIINKVTK